MRKILYILVLVLTMGGVGRGAVPVLPPQFQGARQPQVAIDSLGTIFVAFGSSNSIYCVSSLDRGRTFSKPSRVAVLSKLALGMRRGPRVVASAHNKIISAISSETGDLQVWTSSDGGKWESRGVVNDVARAAREGLHGMASDGDQRVFITWLDLRGGKTQIWGALSEDEGRTWKKNVRIYQSPDGNVCECCHPSVVFTPEGEVTVMWRNWLGGARDMFVASSKEGARFGQAHKVGSGSWPLKGCPMDGGALAISPDRKLITVWRRDQMIFTSQNASMERTLGEGMQPIVFPAKGRMFFVWQRGSTLVLRNDRPSALSRILAEDGRYAAAASGAPDQPAVVVWESTQNGLETIMAEMVE